MNYLPDYPDFAFKVKMDYDTQRGICDLYYKGELINSFETGAFSTNHLPKQMIDYIENKYLFEKTKDQPAEVYPPTWVRIEGKDGNYSGTFVMNIENGCMVTNRSCIEVVCGSQTANQSMQFIPGLHWHKYRKQWISSVKGVIVTEELMNEWLKGM